MHLQVEVVPCLPEPFIRHFGHMGGFVLRRLLGAEPGEHLHEREVGNLLSTHDIHRFKEKADIQFGIGQGACLRYFFQRCLIGQKTGI